MDLLKFARVSGVSQPHWRTSEGITASLPGFESTLAARHT